MRFDISSQEYYVERLNTLDEMSKIYFKLGNTSRGFFSRWLAQYIIGGLPPPLDSMNLQNRIDDAEIRRLSALKHPDASLSSGIALKNKDLQIMGSWQKLEIAKSKNIQSREGFCSFVWKSTWRRLVSFS